jgi:RNA polymerase sigma factor (sigma-70 family)
MGFEPDPRLLSILHASDPAVREEAWSALIREYSPLLLHAARTLGGDRDLVMDRYTFILESLRQDEFHLLRAYSFDRRTKLSTWLIVVATRLCLDHQRHRYGRKRATSRQSLDPQRQSQRRSVVDLAGADIDPDQIPDEESGTPDQPLRKGELSAALEDALATLEPRDRLLLRLRFEEGLSVPRIAGTMGFASPFHAYRRLTQLFAELRLRLRGRGIEDPTV